MAISVSAAWMLLCGEHLEAEEPSPGEQYFGSKLQSLKNDILTFFFYISLKNEECYLKSWSLLDNVPEQSQLGIRYQLPGQTESADQYVLLSAWKLLTAVDQRFPLILTPTETCPRNNGKICSEKYGMFQNRRAVCVTWDMAEQPVPQTPWFVLWWNSFPSFPYYKQPIW